MMSKTNYMDRYCREYVHELEDGSRSEVISEYKIMFMIQDNFTVDELINKVEEIGIEVIGDVDTEVTEWNEPDIVTISTDTEIDDELYATLYEYSERNHVDVTVYEHGNTITKVNGVLVQPYYHELKKECVEMDVLMKMLKEDDPEEWARIQAENVS